MKILLLKASFQGELDTGECPDFPRGKVRGFTKKPFEDLNGMVRVGASSYAKLAGWKLVITGKREEVEESYQADWIDLSRREPPRGGRHYGTLDGSLKMARQWVLEQEKTPPGCFCPCCDRYAKVYRRKLHKGIVRCLIWLFRQKEGWVNVPKTAPRHVISNREFDKLSIWDLAEKKPNEAGKKRCSGFWRITPIGEMFIKDETRLPSHVYLRDGDVIGWERNTTSISEALGEEFDYRELMEEGSSP